MTDTEFERLSTLEHTQFSLCKPKNGQPYLKYDASRPAELNAFLNAHGGNDARFDGEGTAHIHTMVRGESRFVYLKAASWLRCLGPCQFSAMSERVFIETYELL